MESYKREKRHSPTSPRDLKTCKQPADTSTAPLSGSRQLHCIGFKRAIGFRKWMLRLKARVIPSLYINEDRIILFSTLHHVAGYISFHSPLRRGQNNDTTTRTGELSP